MKTVLLRSGYAMPMIGFGTWTLRGEACAEAVKTALLTGYRLIDTAQMYRNEDAVGEGIRRAGIPREELFLTTKVCAPADSYEGTKAQISRSLALLGTDYIDLFLIHEPYREAPAMWRALTEARAEGKLRALGVSNFSARELRDFIGETGEVPASGTPAPRQARSCRHGAPSRKGKTIFLQIPSFSPSQENTGRPLPRRRCGTFSSSAFPPFPKAPARSG